MKRMEIGNRWARSKWFVCLFGRCASIEILQQALPRTPLLLSVSPEVDLGLNIHETNRTQSEGIAWVEAYGRTCES